MGMHRPLQIEQSTRMIEPQFCKVYNHNIIIMSYILLMMNLHNEYRMMKQIYLKTIFKY